jgi:hypothetical protein
VGVSVHTGRLRQVAVKGLLALQRQTSLIRRTDRKSTRVLANFIELVTQREVNCGARGRRGTCWFANFAKSIGRMLQAIFLYSRRRAKPVLDVLSNLLHTRFDFGFHAPL